VFAHIKYAGIREVILATKRQYGLNGTPQRAVYNNLIRKFNALKGTETSRMQDFGNMRAAVVSTMQGFDAAVAGLFFDAVAFRLERRNDYHFDSWKEVSLIFNK